MAYKVTRHGRIKHINPPNKLTKKQQLVIDNLPIDYERIDKIREQFKNVAIKRS
jgi:hypothetical protein